MEMIPCLKCKNDMPRLRLEKFGYKVCVNCSNVSSYKAITTTNGEGDHTWNDIQIMTEDQFSKIPENKSLYNKGQSEMLDFDDEDNNLQGPFTIIEED